MGLSALKKIKVRERLPDLVIDLSPFTGDEGDVIRFRQPDGGDMSPKTAEIERLRAQLPKFDDQHLHAFVTLGACYVADAGETGVITPARTIGQLAVDHYPIFEHVLTEFGKAFPAMVYGFDPDKEKNESGVAA